MKHETTNSVMDDFFADMDSAYKEAPKPKYNVTSGPNREQRRAAEKRKKSMTTEARRKGYSSLEEYQRSVRNAQK